MRKFTINDKEYTAKPFTFNFLCDLEEEGLSLTDIQKKPLSVVRGYFALCYGGDKEAAGAEIEEHIIKGGTFDDLTEALTDAIDKSDFFRNLSRREESENGARTETKKK